MSPGTPGRAPRRAGPTRHHGGSTFAEAPDRIAPEARIIWHAALDPGTLAVAAVRASPMDIDAVRVAALARWLTVAVDRAGIEHVVLSDGWRHIRLDIETGRLSDAEAVILHYRLSGTVSAERRIVPLRRLLDLCRQGRFTHALFPRERRMPRMLTVLRVHDALEDGASQREIGIALFGEEHVARDWNERSDSLRSRVRRLVREARATAQGGYRHFLRRGR